MPVIGTPVVVQAPSGTTSANSGNIIVEFDIVISGVNSFLSLGYTRAEVWVSTDDGDVYEEITASAATAAYVDSALPSTKFNMGGRLLKFIVNGGTEISVSFDPILQYWTSQQVVDRINQESNVATVVDGKVRISSPVATGRASSVEITYSDSPDLGFSLSTTHGKDARPILVQDTFIYKFLDVAGSSSYRYKWRLSANGVNPVSGFSEVTLGQAASGLDANQLSIGTARFYNLDGRPKKTRVLFTVDSVPQNVSSLFISKGQPLVVDSDNEGFLQVTLIRGAKIRAAIEGTTYIREFTVPNSSMFDLLAAMSSSPDPFTVQVPPPFLVRRNI